MGFPRQEYWSGLPFPIPGDLPDPRSEPTSPALAGGFFTSVLPGSPQERRGRPFPLLLVPPKGRSRGESGGRSPSPTQHFTSSATSSFYVTRGEQHWGGSAHDGLLANTGGTSMWAVDHRRSLRPSLGVRVQEPELGIARETHKVGTCEEWWLQAGDCQGQVGPVRVGEYLLLPAHFWLAHRILGAPGTHFSQNWKV